VSSEPSPRWQLSRPPSRCNLVLLLATAVSAILLVAAAAAGGGTLDVPTAIVLGVIEGLTEYLPVSSTGHLTVAERLLGVRGEAADAYVIVIQAGAILAVALLYWSRLRSMAAGLVGRDPAGRRLLVGLAVAFLPAAAIGLVFGDAIKERLFGVGPVAVAWAVGGVVILLRSRKVDPEGRDLSLLGARDALLIGLAQAVALWPGVSRSLVTILAALAVGMSLVAAVEFAFLLGLVTLGAATVFEGAARGGEIVSTYGVLAPAIGFVAAFVSAVVAVRWMVAYLQRGSLSVFGYYRLAIAAVAASLLAFGVV